MLEIKKRDIYLSKGDDAVIGLNLTVGGCQYHMKEGDTLTFSIRKPGEEMPIFTRTLTEPKMIFFGEDTEYMDCQAYQYDVMVQFASGEQKAAMYPAQFFLREVCY